MQKTYKFRLYPDKEKTERLKWSLEQHRFVYNFMLDQWYKSKCKIGWYDLQKVLTELKKTYPQLDMYNEHSRSLQYEIYKIFSQLKSLKELKKKGHKIGKPRFKSKNRFKSLQYNQSGFKVISTDTRHDILHLSKIGDIPMRMHREIDGEIRHVSIKKCSSGKWFACFIVEIDIPPKQPIKKVAGMDMGITEFLTDTTSKLVENPKYLKKSLKRLKHRQKDLSRTKKKSNNRRKQIVRVARLYEQVANQRNDFCHKVAKHYVDTFDFISVEDLNITGMIKSIETEKKKSKVEKCHMRRNTLDVSWRKFFDILSYKAEWAGKTMVKVDPSYTSQIYKYGKSLDRDYNASLNILERGLKQIGQGLSKFTPLEIVPPPEMEHILASTVVESGSSMRSVG